MKVQFSPRFLAITLAIACVLTLCAQASVAQSCPTTTPPLVPVGTPTCTQVFSAVDVRTSEATAGYTGNAGFAPDIFGSSTVNLTCTTSPIIATLSGPLMNTNGSAPVLTSPTATPPSALQAGGSLLVDNNVFVGVNGAVPVDLCDQANNGANQGSSYTPPGTLINETVPSGEAPNCYYGSYGSAVDWPTIPTPVTGADPDTTLVLNGAIVPSGTAGAQTLGFLGGEPVTTFTSPGNGVGAIDISGLLTNSSTPQTVTIQEQDDGGILTASSMFLATNCTVGPVTGPATVSGNTITTSNPSTLTQTFNFDTNNGNVVGFVYDLTPASTANTLTVNPNGPIPQTADLPVDPAAFQPYYAEDTSFATSNCLLHSGEALPSPPYPLQPNGQPPEACKLYTLECYTGTNSNPTGAQCPVSTVANEVVEDAFDGPPFTLQNIYTLNGVFHEGIGLLMASEGWGDDAVPPTLPTEGGPCTFDPSSGLGDVPCPQNLLVSFSGPGNFSGTGETKNPNSTFISIYGVPEDLTSVFVPGEWPDHWVNTSTPNVYFYTQAPNFIKGAWVLNGSKLAPLPNAGNYNPAPIQSITYGISPANSVPQPINEPIPGDTSVPALTTCPFPLPIQTTEPNFAAPVQTLPSMLDGQYLLHYYAEDCAGTQELLFTEAPNTGVWSTNFYTYPIDIDTTKPVVTFYTPATPPRNTTVLAPTGGTYTQSQSVTAYYNCADPPALDQTPNTSSGVVLCGLNLFSPQTTYSVNLTSKVPTGFVGNNQTFTEYAIDGAGNISSSSVTYNVVKAPRP